MAAAAAATRGGDCTTPDPVKLQLQWFIQAQFAGYFAAQEKGFYDDQCLDVEIVEGGVDIVPQQQLADGAVDFALAWVPKALASREAGANIVDIAQVFQRSGTLQVSFKDAGITSPADFAGKTIGNWGFGNEYEIFAALAEAGLDPATTSSLVQQQFDMLGLLSGDIDAAEAMTYNEYAQVLEAVNPDTGELYTPDDFNVVSYEEAGVGMLQDAIWADGERLDVRRRLRRHRGPVRGGVAAGLGVLPRQRRGVPRHRRGQGLEARRQPPAVADERDQQADLAGRRTASASSTRPRGTARRRSRMDTPNLEGATVLTAPPTDGAFTNDIVSLALANLEEIGVDTTGESYHADRGHARGGRRLTSAEAGRAGRSTARPSGLPPPRLYHPDRWRPCCC